MFGFQLGLWMGVGSGGIDNCQQFMENPRKTLFFLISNLMEGSNRAGLLRRLGEIRDSGATAVCLLAIADHGKPY